MILQLDAAQVQHLAERCDDPTLIDYLATQLRDAQLFEDHTPRTVLYYDDGQGLRIGAVMFYDASAADRAWDLLWQRTLDDFARVQPSLFGDL